MRSPDYQGGNSLPSKAVPRSRLPQRIGLYDPQNEHDSCGVAFVATLTGQPRRSIVDAALTALANLDHRGAVGAEVNSGDGAGILIDIPDKFFREEFSGNLPPRGHYAVGMGFLPEGDAEASRLGIETIVAEEGLTTIGWREVPVAEGLVGPMAQSCQPQFAQLFLSGEQARPSGIELDRLAYRVRRRIELELGIYFASLSARTTVYKGMLTTGQLGEFFPDLRHASFEATLGIVHSRFSTNTFPSWPLAHPFRMLAHNGEFNTVRGNRNWMATRESRLRSELLGDFSALLPINTEGLSDSASCDEVLELLHLAGRSLPHAVLMMIPEAWQNHQEMDPKLRSFYQYHGMLMEPWDGPASLSFTDGSVIGAILDRNGLRPGRYWVDKDGLVVLASEVGVLPLPPETIVRKGRLEPGKMFLVDTVGGRIVEDAEIKAELADAAPYGEWVEKNLVRLHSLPPREHVVHTTSSVTRRQQTFGFTEEELRLIVAPMARTGAEPIGSMGTDAPLAVLSERPRLLFDYFAQLFAQVTNPPLDAIREELVTSLGSVIGPEPNLLSATAEHASKLELPFPALNNDDLAAIKRIDKDPRSAGRHHTAVVRGLYRVADGGAGLTARLDEIFAEVDGAIEAGASFLVLSDRESDAEFAPIPSLLLTSAVHHHLVRHRTRTHVGMLVEAGDVREVHHMALLIGYGAGAVNPYLAMESAEELVHSGALVGPSPSDAVGNVIKALGKGVLKVMSKMGISTIGSYRGAQTFEAVGLSEEFVARYFTGTASRLGGIGIDVIADEVGARHAVAYPPSGITPKHRTLTVGGEYQWRREGEAHLFNPDTVFRLQHSTRNRRMEEFRQYTAMVNDQSRQLMTLRGLFELRSERAAVPLDEVEPIAEIVKRFSTGAMSYGSISLEAHETLAIAMNQLGGKSNTGEGGEDTDRLHDPRRRSAIKQVASGRFGVTSDYLTQADDIQIKMAQGAKPGEGGQLPAHKVYPWIAATRHSTPGVGLISPPPHHDIYSIEDLAQLIHDLKNANPAARIHVKLVSELGVGTIATGVSKAHADVVLISGHDGGTGASPLTSLKHAGTPWELGLAETQQTLVLNGLRDRIVVQTDGQLKTGRDVMIAALLGAEEFGFATAPLVVSGCVMMRVCHLDTCPVGVATQNPELRERFTGKPEFVITFFEYIAQEVREYLAELGFRSIEEAVGHVEAIETRAATDYWKASGLDLAPVLQTPPPGSALHRAHEQDHGLDRALDRQLITMAEPALARREPIVIECEIRNVNRTVGTMLGHEVTRRYGAEGLPESTIVVQLTGSAGQSLGAFLPPGITLRLNGDANDYVAKGLSGGRVSVSSQVILDSQDNVIAGNVIGYGATSGEVFIAGRVGERFAVRNSGMTAVVEGIGDHGCEYMTGGTVVVLGSTGRNFGAGMSGGMAFVFDLAVARVNAQALANDDLETRALSESESEELARLISIHRDETKSALAGALLDDWAESRRRFTAIIPRQFAEIGALRAEAISQGEDPNSPAMWSKIMEVSRG